MAGPDWYRWYPAKYASGVIGLTPEQRGVYMDIINIILDRGECPEDYDYLKRACNCQARRLKRIVSDLVEFGKIHKVSGKLCQKKAETERKDSQNFSETQRKRQQKRWAKESENNGVKDTILPDTKTTTTTEHKKEAPNGAYTSEFEMFWEAYPKRMNSSKKNAFASWRRLLKEGDSPEEIIHGARCYQAYCKVTGTTGQFVAHHQTWLNGARHRDYAGETPASVRASSELSPDRSRPGGHERRRTGSIVESIAAATRD